VTLPATRESEHEGTLRLVVARPERGCSTLNHASGLCDPFGEMADAGG
jgi:hypothetical protein